MKLLIVYGTTEGHTRNVSGFLKEEAVKCGHQVKLYDASDEPPSPQGFDAVLIGASIHQGKYQNSITHYVKENREFLNKLPSAFFSVSLTAAGDDAKSWEELEQITTQFLEDTEWRPTNVEQVAGALLYSKYDFFKRFIMRLIAKREGGDTDTSDDYEYTDWDKVKASLDRILEASQKNEANMGAK